jgi:hypothetical protein
MGGRGPAEYDPTWNGGSRLSGRKKTSESSGFCVADLEYSGGNYFRIRNLRWSRCGPIHAVRIDQSYDL